MTYRLCVFLVAALTIAPSWRAQDATAAATTTQPATAKLKVGVLVSQYTATGPYLGGGRPYGYDHAKIADELRDESVQLFPVIEAGSENDADLAEAIKERFPESEGQVYLASDVDALKSLDVIVLARTPNLKEDALAGIHSAVSAGTPLLVVGRVGNLNPGYKDEKVRDLVGMSEAQYAWAPQAQPITLIEKDDPLLKEIEITEDEPLRAMPAGVLGRLKEGGKPLAKLESRDNLRLREEDAPVDVPDYYVLYLSRLGKGQILVCNWTTVPSGLKNFSFYVRCLHRLTEMKGK
jgi:hypothetical protein